MIGSTRNLKVFAYCSPCDMRKGYDGLGSLVTHSLQRNPLSGEVFVFVSRNRKRTKVLHWDGTGLCIYSKRLERGRFACLWKSSAEESLQLTMTELQLFLEGSVLVGRVTLSPPVFQHKIEHKVIASMVTM